MTTQRRKATATPMQTTIMTDQGGTVKTDLPALYFDWRDREWTIAYRGGIYDPNGASLFPGNATFRKLCDVAYELNQTVPDAD